MAGARLEHIAEIEAAIWRELAAAAQQPGHGWRVATLATWDGTRADARSVVLREWDPAARVLVLYTDARSPKAQQIVAHPNGTLVLWSAALSWQLRLRVGLELQTSGLRVSSHWARLKLTPRAQDYLSPWPPGTPLRNEVPPQRKSRDHFAVITARLSELDWLELHPEGHRRATFDAAGGRFVAP